MLRHTQIHEIIETMSNDTLSLYLHVDAGYIENQSEKPAWQIYYKNTLREIEQSLTEAQKSNWLDITNQLDDFFQTYTAQGRTLVLFVDTSELVMEELPFQIDNQSYFGQPYVSPLLWSIDEYEEYLIVMVDSEKARFYKAYLGNLETEAEMTIDLAYDWGEKTLMPAADSDGSALRQGNNRDAFDDMISAHIDRFYNEVADEVKTYIAEHNPMRLIISGDERSAHALHEKLSSSALKHFVAVLAIPMNASSDEIMKRIWTTAYNYEREYEYDLVDHILSQAYAGGVASLGRDNIETAMTMQQVELFVLPYNLLQEDRDYAHDITMWALENNSQIEFVHGQAARKLQSNGGIGARLYYSIETT